MSPEGTINVSRPSAAAGASCLDVLKDDLLLQQAYSTQPVTPLASSGQITPVAPATPSTPVEVSFLMKTLVSVSCDSVR